MRKIGKIARITIKPYPILRFDNEDHNHLLLDPPNNRNIHHNKSIIAKHAEILKASAAEANSVCLASNQIIHCKVKRYNEIGVTYFNHLHTKMEKTLTGFEAWAFQQSLHQL